MPEVPEVVQEGGRSANAIGVVSHAWTLFLTLAEEHDCSQSQITICDNKNHRGLAVDITDCQHHSE